MARYVVLYDDPKRASGPSHSLHRAGCADIARALAHSAAPSTLDIEADSLDEALTMAQHQGERVASDAADVGAVAIAPCAASVA